jgi:catechol 2,3-dioxygenase-like lactoylglutathione lyase family enzyme
MLRNGSTKIGLFQGMFEQNVLTFNPTDARTIQRELKAQGVSFVREADETTDGPEHATLLDPDGNPILFDQF